MGITLFGDQAPVNPTEQQFGFENLTSGVAAGTAADVALAGSTPAELIRSAQLQRSENGYFVPDDTGGGIQVDPESSLLTPEIANQKYGIKGTLSWDKPVRDETAKLQNQFATDRIKRDDILRRSQSGILPSTARMAATLGASMLDPINIAASFVPVVGEARFAALGAIGSRLARGAVEGAVGQALIEPINWANADSEQRDYDMGQVLQDVAFGAGLGATLHLGAYGLKRSAGYVRDILHGVPEFTPPADHAAALSGAISALSEDRPVRVAQYLQAMASRRRDDLLSASSLSGVGSAPEVPLGDALPEFGLNTEPAIPGATHAIDLPTIGENGNEAIYPADTLGYGSEINRLQKAANSEGRALEIRRDQNGTRLVEPIEFKIVDQFPDEHTAQANINRLPPADREGLQAIQFTRADGNQGTAIVRGLSDTQAARLRSQPELVDQALAKSAGQSAVTDLPDTVGTSFEDAWQQMTKAQTQSHAVQPEHAIAMSEWDREAPISKMRQNPEQAASEAESYAQQTDDVLQGIRDKGLLAPEHEAVLAAEDENIRMAEQRGKGLTQAAACIGRALE